MWGNLFFFVSKSPALRTDQDWIGEGGENPEQQTEQPGRRGQWRASGGGWELLASLELSVLTEQSKQE